MIKAVPARPSFPSRDFESPARRTSRRRSRIERRLGCPARPAPRSSAPARIAPAPTSAEPATVRPAPVRPGPGAGRQVQGRAVGDPQPRGRRARRRPPADRLRQRRVLLARRLDGEGRHRRLPAEAAARSASTDSTTTRVEADGTEPPTHPRHAASSPSARATTRPRSTPSSRRSRRRWRPRRTRPRRWRRGPAPPSPGCRSCPSSPATPRLAAPSRPAEVRGQRRRGRDDQPHAAAGPAHRRHDRRRGPGGGRPGARGRP